MFILFIYICCTYHGCIDSIAAPSLYRTLTKHFAERTPLSAESWTNNMHNGVNNTTSDLSSVPSGNGIVVGVVLECGNGISESVSHEPDNIPNLSNTGIDQTGMAHSSDNNLSENPKQPSRYRVLPPSSRKYKGGQTGNGNQGKKKGNPPTPTTNPNGVDGNLVPPHADPPGYPGFSEWLDFQPILLEEGEVVDFNLDVSDSSVQSILEEPPSPEDLACISVSELRHTYGQEIVTMFRKIQRLDFQGKKTIMDKRYLAQCVEHGIYPKWLNVRIGNLDDRNQAKLIGDFKVQTLKNEISLKKRKTQACFIMRHKLTLEFRNRVSKNTADKWVDSIKDSNNSRLERVGIGHFRKFTRLLLDNHKIDASVLTSEARDSGDPFDEGSLNVIFNLSSHTLSPLEEEGLRNGLKFILSPHKIDEVDLYARLESLVGTIYYSEGNPPQLANIASELGREAQNAIERFNHNKPTPNIRKSVLQALKGLASNKDLVISKPDKGNGVVIMDRTDYVNKVMDILGDPNKFKESPTVDLYKPTLKLENEVSFLLKELMKKGVIDPKQYKAAYPSGSRPCLMYGLPKVHKPGTPIRPILSAAGSAVHGLAQIMVPILAPITTNEHTVSNSLVFAEEMAKFDKEGLTFASYDVASLFTNIPLEETVDIISKANKDEKLTRDLDPQILRKIIQTTTQNCFFRFDGKLFSQTDGVAMGSPLGPTLANIFMADFETKHLGNCPEGCRPVLYKRYVDDILLAFKRPEDIGAFWDYYNNLHPNIKFSIEEENGGIINFLDISIKKEGGTSTFRKNTFTGLLTKYNSFLHHQYKSGLISCLLYRSWKLCSSTAAFEEEVSFLKTLFLKNRFPLDLFIEETNRFRAKHCGAPEPTSPQSVASSPSTSVVHDPDDPVIPATPALESEEKNPLTVALPYLGEASLRLRNGIKRSLKKHLPDCKFRFVFKSGAPLASMFKYKDQLASDLCSKLIYQFSCSTCHVDYIGCTIRHLRTRVSEHMGISARTGEPRGTHPSDATAVRQHCLDTGHPISNEDFKVLYNPSQRSLLYISETILIQRNKPSLNDTVGSYPLRVHPTNLGLESHLLARNPDLGVNSAFVGHPATHGNRTGLGAPQCNTPATPRSPPKVYSRTKRLMPICSNVVRRAHGFPPLCIPEVMSGVVGTTTHPPLTSTPADHPVSNSTTDSTQVSSTLVATPGVLAPTTALLRPGGSDPQAASRTRRSSSTVTCTVTGKQVSAGTRGLRPYTSTPPVLGSRVGRARTASRGGLAFSGSAPRRTAVSITNTSSEVVPGPSGGYRTRDWATARAQVGVRSTAIINSRPNGIAATPLRPRTSRVRDWSTVRRSTRIASQKGPQ